jgi:hypothetical protein
MEPFMEGRELKISEHGGWLDGRRGTVATGVHDEEGDVSVAEVVKVMAWERRVVICVACVDVVGIGCISKWRTVLIIAVVVVDKLFRYLERGTMIKKKEKVPRGRHRHV